MIGGEFLSQHRREVCLTQTLQRKESLSPWTPKNKFQGQSHDHGIQKKVEVILQYMSM